MHSVNALLNALPIARGTVKTLHDDHLLVCAEPSAVEWRCSILDMGEEHRLRLLPGDEVLFGLLHVDQHLGVIIGRLGTPRPPEAPEIADHVLLEAGTSLTLKCGDGSITIRNDGKILIKGKNLVSLATESNRIKGGNVAIN